MGRRSYKRFQIALPVTVSGLDTNGNPFSQSATTVEISARGVRLRGISCLRGQRGDLVQIKYKQHSARYRVAWIGQNGSVEQGLIGLECLEDANFLFAERLPPGFACESDPRADTYEVPAVDKKAAADPFDVSAAIAERIKPNRRQEERRRYARFSCSGAVRIWEPETDLAIDARVNEVSLGGCYVEIMSPLRLGTAVRVELAINRQTIRVEGVVKNSQPNFGMGIEFMKIAPAEAEKLQRVVGEVSGALRVETPASPALRPASLPGATLEDAVTLWFGSHDVLTRKEFLELKGETQESGKQDPSQQEFTHSY